MIEMLIKSLLCIFMARGQLATVVSASSVGLLLEWYDFYIYGILAATVLNKLFFPTGDPLASVLLAIAGWAVGFVVRPFGAAFFGRLGDLIGRVRLPCYVVYYGLLHGCHRPSAHV
jgi:MFS family permease